MEIIIIIAVAALAAWVGNQFGIETGKEIRDNERINAAAAACPTCSRFTESAERLELIGARVSGVEYYGAPDPSVDPVEDMNWIFRVAKTHANRVRMHAESEAIKSARTHQVAVKAMKRDAKWNGKDAS